VTSGKVIRAFAHRHRLKEYIEFLGLVDRRTSNRKVMHLSVDRASIHDTKAMRGFFQGRPGRFMAHFTPTHSSWLNLAELWFAQITTKQIRCRSWTGGRSSSERSWTTSITGVNPVDSLCGQKAPSRSSAACERPIVVRHDVVHRTLDQSARAAQIKRLRRVQLVSMLFVILEH
jgi:transposase